MYCKLIDSVYFFNNENFIISVYQINRNGFAYTVSKHLEDDFYRVQEFIINNKSSVIMPENTFLEFCGHLSAIQENVNDLHPIAPFEQHIESLIKRYKIDLIIP